MNTLLEEIWQGKDRNDCDGSIKDFSFLAYRLTAQIKKLPNVKISLKELFFNRF